MSRLPGPVHYAAATARVRARIAQLLSADKWQALIAAADLDELAGLLKGTAYGEALPTAQEQPLRPEILGRGIRAYLIQAWRIPLNLLQGAPRDLLDWLWRRFELNNLKIILRALEQKRPANRIQTSWIPLGPASRLPWNTLAMARSVAGVVESLRSSVQGDFYARALDTALKRYQQEHALFLLEIALDLAYYRRLLYQVQALSGRDRREARRFVGTQMDIQNLLWAFRYRVYFDLSLEEILSYTLQRRLRVNATVVRRIALGASPVEIVGEQWGERLPDRERWADLPTAEALPALELALQRYLAGLAWNTLAGYSLHLGTVLAYGVLLENEARDLITVVEGKAAQWPSERIQSELIGLAVSHA